MTIFLILYMSIAGFLYGQSFLWFTVWLAIPVTIFIIYHLCDSIEPMPSKEEILQEALQSYYKEMLLRGLSDNYGS